MVTNKLNAKIVCDVDGCNNLAEINITNENSVKGRGVNLCYSCVKCYFKELKTYMNNKERELGKTK